MNQTIQAAQSAPANAGNGASAGGWTEPVPAQSGLYHKSHKSDGICTQCNRGVQMTLHNGQQLYCVVCKKVTAHRKAVRK